jgi:cysteine desulfurase
VERVFYFDHAATTALDNRVLSEMMPYLTTSFGNASSIYSLGKEAKEGVQIARLKVAGAINCKIQEVYFTSRRNRKR